MKHNKLWRKLLDKKYIIIIFIVIAVGVVSCDKPTSHIQTQTQPQTQTHTHTYACFDSFIAYRSLETPEAPFVPSIIFFKIKLTEEEIDQYSVNFMITEFLSDFEYKSLLSALKPSKKKSCMALLVFVDIINEAMKLPKLQENISWGLFASKSSIKTSKNTLRGINANKAEKTTNKYCSPLIGNAVTITLTVDLEEGLNFKDAFKYKNDNEKLPKAEVAYSKISFNRKQPVFIREKKSNNIEYSYYPLIIKDYTSTACRKCHTLNGYCKP